MSSNSTRIVALKLHSLHHDDREWILSQLDTVTQSRLSPLLEELSVLGFNVDADLINSVRDVAHDSASVSEVAGYLRKVQLDDECVSMVNLASIAQIDLVFDQEPPIFLQTLVAMQTWSWLSSVADRTDVRRRPSLPQAYGDEGYKPPTLSAQRALLKVVARQLACESHVGNPLINDSADPRGYSIEKKPLFYHFIDKVKPWKR